MAVVLCGITVTHGFFAEDAFTTNHSFALANPGSNRLLTSLSETDRAAILPSFERVHLPLRTSLYEQDGPIRFAYFPLSGIISSTTIMQNGSSVEVGLVGAEGFVGYPLLMGSLVSPQSTFLQVAGDALRIPADDFLQFSRSCPAFRESLLRYTQAVFSQAAQLAACNKLHETEERLARWLLTVQDRLASDSLPLTHEFLAIMLGTRRSSVTISAGILQKTGVIEYSRGLIHVVSRAGLEDSACECYARNRKFAEQAFA